MIERTVKVEDTMGFVYEVQVQHAHEFGFSTAFYKGRPIAQVVEYKITPPIGDDDREWEEHEERVSEFMDAADSDIMPALKEYFDNPNN